jgi:anti-sigma B factor antagonist
MTEPVLNVTTSDIAPDGAVLTAAGDIDFGSHGVLRAAAASAFERNRIRLVVDVGKVRICDSSGLSLFVDLHRQTTARGGWFRLAGPSPLLVKTLAVTNLDRVLPAYETVDAALAG